MSKCRTCKYGGYKMVCPSECYEIFERTDEDYTKWEPKLCIECIHFEDVCEDCHDTVENKNWEPIPNPEPEPDKIPTYQNWYKNFEIDKQLKVIRNEQNDFEVEVKAALSDMEKSLLRLQSRLDEQTKWLDSIHFENFAHRETKPDPKRACSNCLYDIKDGFKGHEDCPGECNNTYSEWKPNVRDN